MINKSKQKIIIGNCDEKIKDKLKTLGFELLIVRDNENLSVQTKNHADLSVIKLPDGKVVVEKTQTELIAELKRENIEFDLTNSSLKMPYPNDTLLNFSIVGKFVIGNHNHIDSTLKQKIKQNNLIEIQTKQGYANCSIVSIAKNAIITDDENIAKITKANSIETLLISKGDVKLKGHDYGFIGGANGLIEENKVLFLGDIREHKDFEKIKVFLSLHGCEFDFIEDLKLTDIGSFIVVDV